MEALLDFNTPQQSKLFKTNRVNLKPINRYYPLTARGKRMAIYGKPLGVWLIGIFIMLGLVDGVMLLATEPKNIFLGVFNFTVSLVVGANFLLLKPWAGITVLILSGLAALSVTIIILLDLGVSATAGAIDLEELVATHWLAADSTNQTANPNQHIFQGSCFSGSMGVD
jgi:hypothetical protein